MVEIGLCIAVILDKLTSCCCIITTCPRLFFMSIDRRVIEVLKVLFSHVVTMERQLNILGLRILHIEMCVMVWVHLQKYYIYFHAHYCVFVKHRLLAFSMNIYIPFTPGNESCRGQFYPNMGSTTFILFQICHLHFAQYVKERGLAMLGIHINTLDVTLYRRFG